MCGSSGACTRRGLARTAASLSFPTLLAVVPLFTVAFVYVARYPMFQQWLDALERFLLKNAARQQRAAVSI